MIKPKRIRKKKELIDAIYLDYKDLQYLKSKIYIEILKNMNRHGDKNSLSSLINKIRAEIPPNKKSKVSWVILIISLLLIAVSVYLVCNTWKNRRVLTDSPVLFILRFSGRSGEGFRGVLQRLAGKTETDCASDRNA